MSSTSGIAASCPHNVTFYACDFGERFLGCCENGSSADICTHGCPPEDLLPASFETEYYDYITTAACTRGDWWSCANTSPPFLGCCLSNPCSGGCPRSNLTAAIFSQNQTENPLYSAISDTPAAASSTTSSFTSTAALSTLVRTTVGAHSATTSPLSIQKNSTRDIVGGVVGGIVAMGGIFIGVLLLNRCLKSQGYKGPDSSGTSKQGSSKDTVPRSTTVSASRSRTPAPYIENRTPLETYSATINASQEDHEKERTAEELPPNHAPLPEIASSDPPQSRHELPSPDPAVEEHVHPRALQPGRPGFRPYSASNLSQVPQPYGLSFRPHSPSRLSVVSSLSSTPPLARGVSPISVANNDDTNTDV